MKISVRNGKENSLLAKNLQKAAGIITPLNALILGRGIYKLLFVNTISRKLAVENSRII